MDLADSLSKLMQKDPASRGEILSTLGQSVVDALAGSSVTLDRKPTPTKRVTKLEANYRPCTKGDKLIESCLVCDLYNLGNCNIMSTTVSQSYVCDYFVPCDRKIRPVGDRVADSDSNQIGQPEDVSWLQGY